MITPTSICEADFTLYVYDCDDLRINSNTHTSFIFPNARFFPVYSLRQERKRHSAAVVYMCVCSCVIFKIMMCTYYCMYCAPGTVYTKLYASSTKYYFYARICGDLPVQVLVIKKHCDTLQFSEWSMLPSTKAFNIKWHSTMLDGYHRGQQNGMFWTMFALQFVPRYRLHFAAH